MSRKYHSDYGPPLGLDDVAGIAKLNQTNPFNNSNSHRVKDHGIKNNVNGSTIVIDAKECNAHKFTVAGPCEIIFNNWELATYVTPIAVTITNPGSSSINIPNVKWVIPATSQEYATLLEYLQAIGRNPATLTAVGKERFIFWTENGGTTICGRFQ